MGANNIVKVLQISRLRTARVEHEPPFLQDMSSSIVNQNWLRRNIRGRAAGGKLLLQEVSITTW
jgi:hypothetical protein